ncbi:MAG: hypothetical protein LQ338_003641 [Usnochroma carphineum]|nr:MAG: hypothetical protein LQ338_003641 [Usnochroma carphineum]
MDEMFASFCEAAWQDANKKMSISSKPDTIDKCQEACNDLEVHRMLRLQWTRIQRALRKSVATPYRRTLLGIADVTSTLAPATSRTTTTTVTEGVTSLPQTLTVAQVTALETTTITAGHIWKRDNAAAVTSNVDVEPEPYGYGYVSLVASSADRNDAIASSVFSACSCLHLAPKTVSSQATVRTTRTIRGLGEETEYAATVTAGTSTLTVTSTVLPQPVSPYFNASEPSANSTSYVTVSSTSTRYSTIYSTGTPLTPYSLNTTSSPPYPTSNSSSAPALPTSAPSSTTSSFLPIGTSIVIDGHAGCPYINNTVFTTSEGEQYQIQCYRAYGGPVSIGLDRPHLLDCIEECDTVNAGFSAIRCYGITWLKYATSGVHCNLKAQSALVNGTYDVLSASAVLLTGVTSPVTGAWGTVG